MRTYYISLLLFFLTKCAFSQKYVISGTITDAQSGESLISANIYDNLTYNGSVTNNYGFYALTVGKGRVLLTCSYIGYNEFQVELNVKSDTIFNIALEPSVEIEEVVVSSQNPQKTVESSQMSRIELKVPDLKSSPALLGEVDIIKTLQTMPGVQGGTEGSAGFFVRGGAPDQNLILLDGVPVYNVNHLFGFFSVFNADAIKNVTLLKGGFPARYGGRLSSVVDIRMKEGDMNAFHGEGSIGLLSSKFTLEGPINKRKTSFLVSGRRTYYDLLTYPFQYLANKGYDEKVYFGAYFYDLNLKINHKFSDNDRIYLSAYLGKDKFFLNEEYNSSSTDYEENWNTEAGLWWGNITSSLRWNHKFNNRLFSNLTATFSDYTFKLYAKDEIETTSNGETSTNNYDVNYYSRIRNYGINYDFDFPLNQNNYLRFGISNTFYQFSPGVGAYKDDETNTDTTYGTKNLPGNVAYLYVEDDLILGERFKANVGLHLSSFQVEDAFYISPEPRISMRYLLLDNLSVKASYVQMTQYINLLTNSTIGLPTDLWVPSTSDLKPQKSWQGALGMAYNLNNTYEFTLEGYYKEMNHLVEFKEGKGFFNLGTGELDEITTQGSGYSYGAEFMVQKSLGKFRGWVSYTLSWSNRKFDEISQGKEFPFKYDRRHNLAIVTNYDISEKVNIGIGWTFYSGSAFSMASYKAISPDAVRNMITQGGYSGSSVNEIIETRNNYRMPYYHRLDVGVNFKKQLKRCERTWSLGVYNAYNRKNAFYLYEDTKTDPETGEEKTVVKQVTLLPVIPYVRYTLKF